MGSFSFTTEIKEDRTLQLPSGTPMGLAKLVDLQAALPMAEGLSQEQINTALELERASWR